MGEDGTQDYVERGDRLRDAGDAAGALDAYNLALDADASDVAALVRAATLLLDCGRFEAAWRYAEQAAEHAAEDAGVFWLLGSTALAAGDGATARTALTHARALGADGPEVLLDLALAAYLALDVAGAAAYIAEILAADPEHSEALAWQEKLGGIDSEHALLTDVARAHCREGRFDVGIDMLTEALMLGDSYEARLYLGRAYLASGDAANAIPLLEAADAMWPEDDEARHSLADARALAEATIQPESAAPAPAAVPAAAAAPAPFRYCVRCGTRLPDDAVFCPECGARRMGGA